MMTNFQTRFSRNGRNVTCSTLALGASTDRHLIVLTLYINDDTTTCASSPRLGWEVSRLDVWQAAITGPVVVWLPSSGRDSAYASVIT